MPGSDRLVAAWRQRVVQDRATAALILRSGEPLWDVVCFHAQQAGEKALKTLLVSEDKLPPRTHDLVQLLNLVTPTHPSLADLVDACALLTQYAVDSPVRD